MKPILILLLLLPLLAFADDFELLCKGEEVKLSISNKPTWRWAMRLVESTNLIVIILGKLGHQSVIGEFLVAVEQQILALPHLKDCPPNRDARWLCRWCKSMNCRRRQESLANLYLKNKAFTDFTKVH